MEPERLVMAVVATVCRRYHELASNLAHLRERAIAEWGSAPSVLVVWARPEPSRLWFFRSLLSSGLVSAVVGRPETEGEAGAATTAPESLNIRLGLERAKAMWPGRSLLVMAADVRVKDGTLSLVKREMETNEACAFHWENGCSREGVWHTNFFAVSSERVWPPVSPVGHADVLERQWGRLLSSLSSSPCPPLLHLSHNSGEKKFSHRHDSEGLPPFLSLAEPSCLSIPLAATGTRTWLAWLSSLLHLSSTFSSRRV